MSGHHVFCHQTGPEIGEAHSRLITLNERYQTHPICQTPSTHMPPCCSHTRQHGITPRALSEFYISAKQLRTLLINKSLHTKVSQSLLREQRLAVGWLMHAEMFFFVFFTPAVTMKELHHLFIAHLLIKVFKVVHKTD